MAGVVGPGDQPVAAAISARKGSLAAAQQHAGITDAHRYQLPALLPCDPALHVRDHCVSLITGAVNRWNESRLLLFGNLCRGGIAAKAPAQIRSTRRYL